MTGDHPSGPFWHSTRITFQGGQDLDLLAAFGTMAPAALPLPRLNGERPSFEEFYRAEMPLLVRFVRRYGADVHAATDAAQDAFTEAYPQWNTIENPRAWLRRVAGRIYYRKRLRETPVEEVPDRPEIYQDPVEIGEQGARVYRALAALPERQRQVMAWHLDGYGSAEIAGELGITVAAVRQNLSRARRALKQSIGLDRGDQEGEIR